MIRLFRILGLPAAVTLSLLLTACFPMGPGGMPVLSPAEGMGRGHDSTMGRGMMGQEAPPPAITPAPTATPGGTATVSYRQDIQPILNRYCVSCHGGQASLYLDSYDHVLAGSARGPVVIPGNPQASELVRRIKGVSQPRMPLGGAPLPASDIYSLISSLLACHRLQPLSFARPPQQLQHVDGIVHCEDCRQRPAPQKQERE